MTLVFHICPESNQLKFSIPNILKPVLWSPGVVESHGTMGWPKIKNNMFLCTRFKYCNYLLNSILRFLVRWLGPWPVNWMSPVRIPLKSLVTYILLKFLKNGCFCFSTIPLWIHNIEVKSFLKLYSDFLGSQN